MFTVTCELTSDDTWEETVCAFRADMPVAPRGVCVLSSVTLLFNNPAHKVLDGRLHINWFDQGVHNFYAELGGATMHNESSIDLGMTGELAVVHRHVLSERYPLVCTGSRNLFGSVSLSRDPTDTGTGAPTRIVLVFNVPTASSSYSGALPSSSSSRRR